LANNEKIFSTCVCIYLPKNGEFRRTESDTEADLSLAKISQKWLREEQEPYAALPDPGINQHHPSAEIKRYTVGRCFL
jgi:hypothetical protein